MKKTVILMCAVFLLVAANVRADTRYVNDITEITMRLGPGVDFRVIKTLKSGDTVTAISSKKGWTRVKTESGETGWVVSRYLTADKPASVIANELKGSLAPLRNQVATLKAENDQLAKENQALKEQINTARNEMTKAATAYDNLAKNSKNYLKVKADNKKLLLELDRKKSRIKTLEKKVSDQYLSTGIKWFLAGAGVLIIGIFIGLSNKRKRSPLR